MTDAGPCLIGDEEPPVLDRDLVWENAELRKEVTDANVARLTHEQTIRDLRAEVETLKSWLLSITLASYKHKEERDSALAEVEELKQENRLMAEDAGRG